MAGGGTLLKLDEPLFVVPGWLPPDFFGLAV